jgi:methyltransferase-like protein
VYSWVPVAVRDKILDICRQHLTPQGLAYISYNIYPGWHLLGIVRDMMLYYTRRVAEPYQRAKKARELLDAVVEMMPTLTPQPSARLQANFMIFESVQELFRQQPDEYLLHDPLEVINEPLYLHQFVERAEQHELQYVTDAESSAMFAAYFPAEFTDTLQQVAQTELEIEQFMDFLYSRSFRQTLLCHQEISLNQGEVSLEQWTDLFVASAVKVIEENKVDIFSTEMAKFRGPLGTTLATDQPLHKAALLYLAEVWPRPMLFKELLQVARSRLNSDLAQMKGAADSEREARMLGSMLLKGYAVGAVELYAHRPPFVSEVSTYPVVSALARQQAQHTRHVTNQCHKMITLEDGVSRYLLPYLDGQHDRAALLEMLAAWVTQGKLVIQFDGSAGQSLTQLHPVLADILDQTLDKLKQDALLVG